MFPSADGPSGSTAGAALPLHQGDLPSAHLRRAVPGAGGQARPTHPGPVPHAGGYRPGFGRPSRCQVGRDARCADRGYSQRAIARHLRLHRATVTKYLRAASCPHPGPRPNRRSLIDPWVPFLQERWAAGCRNAQELFREIQALGFPGGRSIVNARLAEWRTGPRRPGPYPVAEPAPADAVLPALPAVKHWSPRRTRGLLLTNEGDLTDDQRAYRSQLRTRCPAIGKARELVQEFWHLVNERDQAALGPWLANARSSGLAELREFAAGIERDRAAVEAALRLDVSNGQTEGQITKVKLLKRAAYGRASLTLLRARLLRAG